MTFIGKKVHHNINKKPRLMKLCILVAYKFLTENLNFGVSQCISGHVISQNMEFIRLAISQPIFKDRDFWFGPKNSSTFLVT